MRIAHICPHCRQVVPARQRCDCRPIPKRDETARLERQPYRKAYASTAYQKARRLRYRMADGHCEACGVELGKGWQAHHLLKIRDGGTDEVENLRVLCEPCHTELHRREARHQR